MILVFLYGPVASGKLTIARELAARTGFALFHNHLVVDAVMAVFPFGSESFVRLRERLWMDLISEAARLQRSIVFTFAPEPTVERGFAQRVVSAVEGAGGKVVFVELTVPIEEQERRLVDPSRAAYGKLRSVELLRRLRREFADATAEMPAPTLTIDTSTHTPLESAAAIHSLLGSSAQS